MASSERLDLEEERARTEELWRRVSDGHVSMPVAAATTFHQVHRTTRAIVTRRDYDDALNIAASALSRLIPIYSTGLRKERIAIAEVDLRTQRFARGATQLRFTDGTVIENLSVQRSQMMSAISLIKRAGLPFSFAFIPPGRAPEVPSESQSSDEAGSDNGLSDKAGEGK